jgi:hypothetical protein
MRAVKARRCKHWLSGEISEIDATRLLSALDDDDIALASGSVDVFDFEPGMSPEEG